MNKIQLFRSTLEKVCKEEPFKMKVEFSNFRKYKMMYNGCIPLYIEIKEVIEDVDSIRVEDINIEELENAIRYVVSEKVRNRKPLI